MNAMEGHRLEPENWEEFGKDMHVLLDHAAGVPIDALALAVGGIPSFPLLDPQPLCCSWQSPLAAAVGIPC